MYFLHSTHTPYRVFFFFLNSIIQKKEKLYDLKGGKKVVNCVINRFRKSPPYNRARACSLYLRVPIEHTLPTQHYQHLDTESLLFYFYDYYFIFLRSKKKKFYFFCLAFALLFRNSIFFKEGGLYFLLRYIYIYVLYFDGILR